MNHLCPLAILAITSCSSFAEPPASPEPLEYRQEAKHPENWPAPGPFSEVSQKDYPTYRAAVAKGSSRTLTFWRLFNHIKSNDIAMTAPVEMTFSDDSGMTDMSFLYSSQTLGATGTTGKNINVVDQTETTVLSYGFVGPANKQAIANAKTEVDKVLANKQIEAIRYRLLGYNGPSVPQSEKTWEFQAVIKESKVAE